MHRSKKLSQEHGCHCGIEDQPSSLSNHLSGELMRLDSLAYIVEEQQRVSMKQLIWKTQAEITTGTDSQCLIVYKYQTMSMQVKRPWPLSINTNTTEKTATAERKKHYTAQTALLWIRARIVDKACRLNTYAPKAQGLHQLGAMGLQFNYFVVLKHEHELKTFFFKSAKEFKSFRSYIVIVYNNSHNNHL